MMLADLNRILGKFPGKHLVYCFAYGSGVFRQAGRANDRAMVDMIFVVNDTTSFHRDNLMANPDHYSWMRNFGASVVSGVQTSCGAHVYFNTGVTVGDVTFKYGVIDEVDFRRDLRTWRTLYVAGRLHKPVLVLRDRGVCGDLVAGNLKGAVHAALLQLPARFTETELYATVAGLSYRGDFRMIIGEDKNKVANIVAPQMDEFRSLYASAIRSMGDRLSVGSSSATEQDVSWQCKHYHLQRLPRNLKRVLLGRDYRDHYHDRDHYDDALRELAERDDLSEIIRKGICRIVFYSSLVQSVKGIPTAGLLKSVVYSYNKLNKMVKSMFL